MSTFKADGGPAHPLPDLCSKCGARAIAPGMSVRDFFAAQVLPVVISSEGGDAGVAERAYALADAMLIQREITNQSLLNAQATSELRNALEELATAVHTVGKEWFALRVNGDAEYVRGAYTAAKKALEKWFPESL